MKIVSGKGGKVSIITIRRPSNFHAHFRDGDLMQVVAKHIMRNYRYVLAMPNNGPILTVEQMIEYHDQLKIIAKKIPRKLGLVMTLYLSGKTTPAMIEQMAGLDFSSAVKYYPPEPGATTGAGHGVPLDLCDDVLRAMEVNGIPLLGHFESTHDKDGLELPREKREGYMVDNYLWGFRDKYPNLKISFEHASTASAVKWVAADTSGNTFMTVTPQHAFCTGEDFPTLGVDLDCQPIPKTRADREAVCAFITCGDARVGAGNDDAPHLHKKKVEGAKGCWTPHAIEIFATVFDGRNALDRRFEAFMSLNAPRWWNLPLPGDDDTITIERGLSRIPAPVKVASENDFIVPLGWAESGDLLELEFKIKH